MDKYLQFEEAIQNEPYIRTPYEYIYDYFPDANSYDLTECFRIILVHNHRITIKLDEENKKIKEMTEEALPITASKKEEQQTKPKERVDNFEPYPQSTLVTDIINSIRFYTDVNEFTTNTKNLSETEICLVKMYLLREINALKRTIRSLTNINPEQDLSELRTTLVLYRKYLEELVIKQEIMIEEQEEKEENHNIRIILLPNSKTSTYLLEDIRRYPESYDEISIAFDNIISKKFLSSKSIVSIKDSEEKLYEYKRSNGIRIMFIKKGNDIIICSLFYKDKQRSTKISAYYEEAQKRYQNFLNQNIDLNDPDFNIEQSEQIGLIYGEIETSPVYTIKKGGE